MFATRITLSAFLLAGVLLSGAAGAQTDPMAAPPAPAAPPVGVLSTTRTTRDVDANGDTLTSSSTTYRDPMGVAVDKQTTTQTFVPAPPPVSTTTSTSTTVTTSPPPQ